MDRLRTLLRYGVAVTMTATEGKRVTLSNALALTLVLLSLPLALIASLTSAAALTWLTIPLCLALLVVPWLNRAGRARASRTLILALLNGLAALHAAYLGPEPAAHMSLLALVCLPVVLFELRHWRRIAVGVATPLLLLAAVHHPAWPSPALDPAARALLNASAGVTATLIILAAVVYFAVVNDQVERELEEAVECLESSLLERQRLAVESAEQSKFLANMSHELRTPLNAIIGYSELLRESPRGRTIAEAEPDLKRITAAGEHLLRLISEILDHSRLAAGDAELSVAPFSLGELLARALAFARPQCAQKGLELREELAPGIEDAVMRSDAAKLEQVLLSLLNNAIKFTREGSVTLRASLVDGGARARFEIADTGIGISEDTSRSIFEPFSQGDMSFTREYGGTGLGLTICKSFTELLGGRIELRSSKGDGSCFTIVLPMAPERETASTGSRAA